MEDINCFLMDICLIGIYHRVLKHTGDVHGMDVQNVLHVLWQHVME